MAHEYHYDNSLQFERPAYKSARSAVVHAYRIKERKRSACGEALGIPNYHKYSCKEVSGTVLPTTCDNSPAPSWASWLLRVMVTGWYGSQKCPLCNILYSGVGRAGYVLIGLVPLSCPSIPPALPLSCRWCVLCRVGMQS